MNVALCPLSRNVVSANPASPSGAGSAAGTASMSVARGRTLAVTAITPPLARPRWTGIDRTPICTGRFCTPNQPQCDTGRPVAGPLRGQVVRVLRQVLGRTVGDQHEIFEPYAAVALAVEAGLDRDDVARAK